MTRAGIAALARTSTTRYIAGTMAAGVCLSVALLSWFGYRAIRESQRSSRLLAERRTSDTADLVLMAVAHDMRAVHDSVLLSSQWTVDMLDSPYDISTVVAGAFARYPYPESFFGWRGELTDAGLVFFDRADRPPAWLEAVPASGRFPVVAHAEPSLGAIIVPRIRRNAIKGGELSVFELELSGVPYQVITRLLYADAFRERLVGGFGFTVNLAWARGFYFTDMIKQVGGLGGPRAGLLLSIADEAGARVADSGDSSADVALSRRTFPLLFFDPLTVALDQPPDLRIRDWAVQVEIAASEPGIPSRGPADVGTLVVVAAAAGALALGLALTSRAVRASARLAEMRSDFMSTVTHELKTPLATIRAVGDSVASGRVTGGEKLREYAQMVVQESKRLTRLVDNMLAYSRITDVTEAYQFEPLALCGLLDDALRGFAAQLSSGGFEVRVEVPPDLPPIRADRTAMRLLLDNVIDNALRYSTGARWLGIRAERAGDIVRILVSDRGVGIPADEIDHVVRKFFRGRRSGSGGSGLGLAIANRIISDHGGRLTIESRENAGTTVTLALPVAGQSDEDTHSRG